jgi:glycosyltransferase involved in cell wall biosynthesis
LKTLVIANAVGGVTDYVLDGFTGFIADFNNIDHYVELIQDVLNYPERKNQILENAFALIQECYSPDSQVKEMKRVLNENMKS